MNQTSNTFEELIAVLQQLDRDLLAIEMTKSALARQEGLLHSISLSTNDGAPIRKADLKELGAAGVIIGNVSSEVVIGLTANAIETFGIRLKRHLNVDWEPFRKPMEDIRFSSRPKQFRALNNVFKHREGYVEVASSRSARFMVSAGYFEDGTYLKHLSPDSILPDLDLAIYETFAHMYAISSKVAHVRDRFEGQMGPALVQRMKESVIFRIIRPTLSGDVPRQGA